MRSQAADRTLGSPIPRKPGSEPGALYGLPGDPLGRSPSLQGLRRRLGFARPLRRYYETVRLPGDVHVRRAALGLLEPSLAASYGKGIAWVSRFSRLESCRMHRFSDSAVLTGISPLTTPFA